MHPDCVGSAHPWRVAKEMKPAKLQKLNAGNDQWQEEEQKEGLRGMEVFEFPNRGPKGRPGLVELFHEQGSYHENRYGQPPKTKNNLPLAADDQVS
jgi:hypothetical protein